MPLSVGDKLGHYEVLSLLGQGGMGEVYRARDTTLQRDVALKVLPATFLRDPERLARFQREAQVLASLDHPNIGHIHGIVDSEDSRGLVLALIEGPTLADRIAAGPLPQAEAIAIAKQIIEALEYAHDRGVVHRDLKPANIKITPEGVVKVLDFGLAKVLEDEPPKSALGNSPTMTLGHTRAGVILGTAAYMSPEQAIGRPVDRRSDIFSFGAVLYEMLTGKRAYPGTTTPDVLEAVVKLDPNWSLLPPGTPRYLNKLLERMLAKDRKERLQAIGEARIMLAKPHGDEAVSAAGVSSPSSRLGRSPWIAVALLAVVVGVALWAPWRKTPETRVYAFDLFPPEGQTFNPQSQLSPDGKLIALMVRDTGNPTNYLVVRRLDSLELRKLSGTENANRPAWSPDSRSLAFVAGNKLKRIDVNGGPPQTLTDFEAGFIPFIAWGSQNVILFSRTADGLWQIPAAGGKPARVTIMDKEGQAVLHAGPQFLPDGRHFLYFGQGAATTYAGSLDSPPEKNRIEVLKDSNTISYYARGPDGSDYLVFLREGALLAQPFDLRALKLTGDPFVVAHLTIATGSILPAASISEAGLLLYAVGFASSEVQLSWFDRTGKLLSNVGPPGNYDEFSLSPDERRIAVVHREGSNSDIWLWDLVREGVRSRFTFDPALERTPVWSPDGSSVLFAGGADRLTLYEKPVNSTGSEQPVKDNQNSIKGQPVNFSRDGKRLLYRGSGNDLWILADGKASIFQQTPYRENAAQFSPDDKWIAYASDETGRSEIWVQTFPASGGKWQLSTAGGSQPRWSADGREIFYLAAGGKLTAVKVTTGSSFEYGTATALFQTRVDGRIPQGGWGYAVSRDGRFLVENVTGDPKPAPLTIVTNWWSAIPK